MEKVKEMLVVSPSDTPEKKYNKNLIKIALIGLAGYVAYRLIKK